MSTARFFNPSLLELPVPESISRYLGSKRWLPTRFPAKCRLPSRGRVYYEPFVGGGAMAFRYAQHGCRMVLGDANPRLIGLYRWIQKDPVALITMLEGFSISNRVAETRAPDVFMLLREQMNQAPPEGLFSAATMLYILNTGYNGVYRVNRKGQCNTPWGKPSPKKDIVHAQDLRAISKLLRNATFCCGDFEKTIAPARRGDFVFFDPPYVGEAGSSEFVGYAAGGWTELDRKRLCAVLRDLDQRGVHFLLSDRDGASPRSVYGLFSVTEVKVQRSVSCDPEKRGKAAEVLVSNF